MVATVLARRPSTCPSASTTNHFRSISLSVGIGVGIVSPCASLKWAYVQEFRQRHTLSEAASAVNGCYAGVPVARVLSGHGHSDFTGHTGHAGLRAVHVRRP